MDYDTEKIDEMTLALMWLVMQKDKYGWRAWKGFDWETMNRLSEKGFISNPKSKAKSVAVSDDAAQLAEQLFDKHFGKAG